jgi:hippurate hydrolase
MAAAAELNETVRGAGGHGSAPHLARDPNQVLAEIVAGLQTMVTRRFSAFDPVVVTVGWLAGGERGPNTVIPSTASFGATLRTFSPENLAAIERYSSELVNGIAGAYGLEADIEFRVITVPLQNSAEHVALAEKVATEMFGEERFGILEAPIGGAEDFASVLRAVPGAFVFVGACPPGLDPKTAPNNHSNLVVFDDTVLPDAAAYLAALAFARLSTGR